MVSFKHQGFGLVALAAVAAASAVLELDPSNHDHVIKKPAFVKYYATWCGHCKNMAPAWDELAEMFKNQNVQIAKVDADKHKSLGKKAKVQGFPTLKFFDGKSPEPQDYNGGRDVDSLASFVTAQTGLKPRKAPKEASRVAQLTNVTLTEYIDTKKKNVFAAFTAPGCGDCKSLAPVWENLAKTFANDNNIVIGKVDCGNNNMLCEKQGGNSHHTIKYFSAGSSEGTPYEGGRAEGSLVKFVNEKTGNQRLPGGSLNTVAGTLPLMARFVETYHDGKDQIVDIAASAKKEAETLTQDIEQKYVKYYLHVMKKLGENKDYAAKELARLEGILSKNAVDTLKRDEFQRRANVLRQFAEEVVKETKEEL